jgi:hypothetical protein
MAAEAFSGGGTSLRRHILFLGIVALLSTCVLGQSTPRFDVFGGYSYLRSDPGPGFGKANANGWGSSLNWNFNRWLGVKADMSGTYCCVGQREHNFLFGPQIGFRGQRANYFFHGLGGVSHGNPGGVSSNVAAWAFGGGMDWKLASHPRLSLRLIQGDFLRTQYASVAQSTFRYSTGLVFSFGGTK